MAEFNRLDKNFFSELTFHDVGEEGTEDLLDPTEEERKILEEELNQWKQLLNSPLGRAVRAFIRSQKARSIAIGMASVADLQPYPADIIQRLKDEAVGSYQVWDYIEKRPLDLQKRLNFLEEKKKEAPVRRMKKTLTKGKKKRIIDS